MLTLSTLAWVPGIARADPPSTHTRAREAYDRGTLAYQHGDYARAGAEFAQADSLEPSAVSLQAGLDSALLADDPVLGATLLARVDARGSDPALSRMAANARTRFAHRTGQIRFECHPQQPCLVAVDGAGVDASTPHFVLPGSHMVALQTGSRTEEHMVDVKADQAATVALAGVEPPSGGGAGAGDTDREAPGVTPVWFFVGVGLTAALGAATVFSLADTVSKHNEFISRGCPSVSSNDCLQLGDSGSAAQLRTDVLLGATAAAGAATVILGVFFVRWHPAGARTSLGVGPGPSAALGVAF